VFVEEMVSFDLDAAGHNVLDRISKADEEPNENVWLIMPDVLGPLELLVDRDGHVIAVLIKLYDKAVTMVQICAFTNRLEEEGIVELSGKRDITGWERHDVPLLAVFILCLKTEDEDGVVFLSSGTYKQNPDLSGFCFQSLIDLVLENLYLVM